MSLKLWAYFVLGTALILVCLSALTTAAAGYSDPIIEEISYTGDAFATGNGPTLTQDALRLPDGETTAVYTSPPITAPFPFNAVVPQWRATLPDGASLDVQLRTRTASGTWSKWQHIRAHGDWSMPGEALAIGDMVTVPGIDRRHDHVQLKISLSQIGNVTPQLHEITIVYIDSTSGPTVEQMVAQQRARDAARGERPQSDTYPRPTIISRDVWCTSENCAYSDDFEYADATHMVLHHTVSNNDSADWAATLRAIWSFHTHSRDWGDIGYNYLVDPEGNIYEGHLSEDYEILDVAGTHAGGANLGSMGVALLGTYTEAEHALPGVAPSDEMVDSLVALLSWKADQRNIDVYDASDALPNLNHGLPHLSGHRDVYGNTECPGDQTHGLIPLLIERVAQNIGLANPYTVIDERSDQLTLSAATWLEGNDECGTNGHAFYTYSTQEATSSTNWGVWRPDIEETAVYQIDVRIPYCYTGRAETAGAIYKIKHAYGTSTATVDQNINVGLWVTLGAFKLEAGNDNSIFLSDLTHTDSGLGVWFDDIRLRNLGNAEPTLALNAPQSERWLTDSTVTFDWSLHFAPVINTLTTTLQVGTTPAFTDTIMTRTWPSNPISATHTFTEDAPLLFWRVSTTLGDGGWTVLSPTEHFGLDTAAPTSTLIALHKYRDDWYRLHWKGGDAGSGLAGYNVAYRPIGGTAVLPWTPWLTQTLHTEADFTPPNPTQPYEFRIQAVDQAGHVEHKPGVDGRTTEANPLPHAIMLPLVTKP